MGKKGYNWKSRQVVKTVIDDSGTKQIHLDLNVKGSYDQSNPLVLPSKKRKTTIKDEKAKVTKILSRKQRKHLEKVVEKKKKKLNRTSLLEALSQCQATPEEFNQLTSITDIQTKGLKKYFQDLQKPEKEEYTVEKETSAAKIENCGSLKGAKRKHIPVVDKRSIGNDNPNVIGFESSGSDLESDEDSDSVTEEPDEKKLKSDDAEVIEYVPEVVESVPEVVESVAEVVESVPEVAKVVEETPVEAKHEERKPAVYVPVNRTSAIQKVRLKLPILAEEQQIMEMINENSIVILAGETGSGKTTQVPQFLYEAGYALEKMIAITEPRRVAAISMSQRVAEEMSLTSNEVSYLIRFEGNVTDKTKIKFMTDGVLLKEIQTDFLLTKYSVVILDEAHERSVFTDVLIGLLSRIVLLRNKRKNPLKLIIMSATLRLDDFVENKRLFKVAPPVLKVEARQYPVTVHFNKRTNENYLQEAFNKVVKIHTQLPDGGILVFVTGQQEVNSLVRRLRNTFKRKSHANVNAEKQQESDGGSNSEDEVIDRRLKNTLKEKRKLKKQKAIPNKISLDDYSIPGDNELGSDIEPESDEDDVIEEANIPNAQPMWVLPMYSFLPSHKQAEVFKKPPEGYRLCIVSTNVAETSLTIPNIRYIVDTGKTKLKLYDKVTGVSSYVVSWTSKASADQRAGRAGRTGPGHCYRLFSSAVFNDVFLQFSVPEIQQKPVDDLYLQMKCMHIDKVVNFPFPSMPDLTQLNTAEKRLEILGALDKSKVTKLGRVIAKFPVLPRFGKMLALSHQHSLLPYTICMVASLSVQEVLLETPVAWTGKEELKQIRQKWFATRLQWAGMGNSLLLGDLMVLLRAVGAAEYANSQGKLEQFCNENGLRQKAVIEIRKLRMQLTNEIKMNVPDSDVVVDPKLIPPTDVQTKLLRQILLAGMGDQVAKKIMPEELKKGEDKAKFKYAYRANNMEEPVFLHQGSVLKRKLPEYVIYQEIYETNKMYMRGVTAIEPEWLPIYVASVCQLGEPLEDPEPRYEPSDGKVYCRMTGTFGTQAWPLPIVEVEYPKNLELYKWFARFILEGKVLKKLQKYAKNLLNNPNIMHKSWAKLQTKTDVILKALLDQSVHNKEVLVKKLTEDPNYLLPEYLKWLPQSAHGEVKLLWPPLD